MGFMDDLASGAKSLLGVTEKAVLTIADFSEIKIKEGPAPKPSAGSGGGLGNFADAADIGSFDTNLAMGFAAGVRGFSEETKAFEFTGNAKKYKFKVQFNPNELYINGYGGEELPTQNYTGAMRDPDTGMLIHPSHHRLRGGNHMAPADTRIEMSFTIIFDKVDPQDAFYSDKFALNAVSIGKGVAKGVMTAMGKKNNSVQPEVEALTAVVRDKNKRLACLTWGDMSYQGIINSVNAEYQMFNVNGEPVRATVAINMVLFDETDMGPNVDIWQREYTRDFGSLKSPLGAAGAAAGALGDGGAFGDVPNIGLGNY
ncbi:MAG: hypothetical protein K6E91_04585 [Butyrivibrio sp.]|nr:hypothetical protein [Butyrivibrio sp.]